MPRETLILINIHLYCPRNTVTMWGSTAVLARRPSQHNPQRSLWPKTSQLFSAFFFHFICWFGTEQEPQETHRNPYFALWILVRFRSPWLVDTTLYKASPSSQNLGLLWTLAGGSKDDCEIFFLASSKGRMTEMPMEDHLHRQEKNKTFKMRSWKPSYERLLWMQWR